MLRFINTIKQQNQSTLFIGFAVFIAGVITTLYSCGLIND